MPSVDRLYTPARHCCTSAGLPHRTIIAPRKTASRPNLGARGYNPTPKTIDSRPPSFISQHPPARAGTVLAHGVRPGCLGDGAHPLARLGPAGSSLVCRAGHRATHYPMVVGGTDQSLCARFFSWRGLGGAGRLDSGQPAPGLPPLAPTTGFRGAVGRSGAGLAGQ